MTDRLPDDPISPDVVEDILGPDPKPGQKRKSREYRNMGIVAPSVARSIRHRAAMLEKDPEKTRAYFKRAMLVHALILDYQARNAADTDALKSAASGFIQVVNTVMPKKSVAKK